MEKKQYINNYFPHDSNARNSDKLIRLRMRHKSAGYGVFFMILERLREEPEYMSIKDYNMIAFDLREDALLVKSVIEDFGLFVFTEDGKYFYSESFKRRMEIKDDKSKKRSEAGKKGMINRWGNNNVITNDVSSDNNVITNEAKNITSKVKERKEKKTKGNNTPLPPPEGEGKEDKNDSKGINSKARFIFEDYFRTTFSNEYYWTPKDAGAMSQLLKKISFSREKKNMLTDNDSMIKALEAFLYSIKDTWILEHFSVTIINSKYNEIVASVKDSKLNQGHTNGNNSRKSNQDIPKQVDYSQKDYSESF